MDPAECLLSKGAVPFSFYGANAPSVRKAPRAFGRGPAVRSENVAITGEESLLSKGAVPFSFLWGVRPISPESPKGFSGVALPSGEKTLPSGA